jgi:hypothetical protein
MMSDERMGRVWEMRRRREIGEVFVLRLDDQETTRDSKTIMIYLC